MEAEWEIAAAEVEKMVEGYLLIDIRDAGTAAYGTIPNAIVIAQRDLAAQIEEFSSTKGIIGGFFLL